MPAGIQIWNAAGVEVMNITSRLGLYLGTIETGTTAGSINVPGLSKGTPFAFALGEQWAYAGQSSVPNITISGTTISWSWSQQYGYFASVTIVYGIY